MASLEADMFCKRANCFINRIEYWKAFQLKSEVWVQKKKVKSRTKAIAVEIFIEVLNISSQLSRA
jgi:plasmid maintenance system antidote protein VapI